MVGLYDIYDKLINEFHSVVNWDRNFVEFDNSGYKCKIFASINDGEYFNDPSNPLPPEPPEPPNDVDEILNIVQGSDEIRFDQDPEYKSLNKLLDMIEGKEEIENV